MDELIAQGTARPAAAQKRLIAVEPFMANLAVSGFNPQQHRLPVSATFSNTHAAEYSEGERREARGEGKSEGFGVKGERHRTCQLTYLNLAHRATAFFHPPT